MAALMMRPRGSGVWPEETAMVALGNVCAPICAMWRAN